MDELAGMPSRKQPTVALSVRVASSVAARARTVARDAAGKPHYLTLSKLVEEALVERVAYYERLMAEGEVQPPRSPSRNTVHR